MKMNANDAYEQIMQCVNKEEELVNVYGCKFTKIVDEDVIFGGEDLFMLCKQSNLTPYVKKIVGSDGNLQICYHSARGGTLSMRVEYEDGYWDDKISENAEFFVNTLAPYIKYKACPGDDYDKDAFEITINNVNDDFTANVLQMLLMYAFVIEV